MRRLPAVVIFSLIAALAIAEIPRDKAATKSVATEDGISVYFSPDGGCTAAIVREIDAAKKTVLIQAYSFTSAPIAKAVADAQRRGVKITAVLDEKNRTAKYSAATFLFNAGVAVFIDARHAIAHNKIILIDGQTVITGSFNFTKVAEDSNAENLLILKGKPSLYAAYERNFQNHLAHSEKYEGKK